MIRLEESTIIEAPIERCFDLSRSVEVHLLSNIHSGEQALSVGGVTSGLVDLSEEVTWRAKLRHLAEPDQQDHRDGIAPLLPGHNDSRNFPLYAGRSPI